MKQKIQGFTVIEVVLVLAIAGLIFAGAFIALPALWANQRDADRKSNVTKVVSAIKTYQTNNSRGALPTDDGGFTTIERVRGANPSAGTWQYLLKNFADKNTDLTDPATDTYQFSIFDCLDTDGKTLTPGAPCQDSGDMMAFDFSDMNLEEGFRSNVPYSSMADWILIVKSAVCNGNVAVKSNNPRNVAVLQVMEQGHVFYCANT